MVVNKKRGKRIGDAVHLSYPVSSYIHTVLRQSRNGGRFIFE
jgi:hypothetical protein